MDYYEVISKLLKWENCSDKGINWSQTRYNGYMICKPNSPTQYHYFKIDTEHPMKDTYRPLIEILQEIDRNE